MKQTKRELFDSWKELFNSRKPEYFRCTSSREQQNARQKLSPAGDAISDDRIDIKYSRGISTFQRRLTKHRRRKIKVWSDARSSKWSASPRKLEAKVAPICEIIKRSASTQTSRQIVLPNPIEIKHVDGQKMSRSVQTPISMQQRPKFESFSRRTATHSVSPRPSMKNIVQQKPCKTFSSSNSPTPSGVLMRQMDGSLTNSGDGLEQGKQQSEQEKKQKLLLEEAVAIAMHAAPWTSRSSSTIAKMMTTPSHQSNIKTWSSMGRDASARHGLIDNREAARLLKNYSVPAGWSSQLKRDFPVGIYHTTWMKQPCATITIHMNDQNDITPRQFLSFFNIVVHYMTAKEFIDWCNERQMHNTVLDYLRLHNISKYYGPGTGKLRALTRLKDALGVDLSDRFYHPNGGWRRAIRFIAKTEQVATQMSNIYLQSLPSQVFSLVVQPYAFTHRKECGNRANKQVKDTHMNGKNNNIMELPSPGRHQSQSPSRKSPYKPIFSYNGSTAGNFGIKRFKGQI